MFTHGAAHTLPIYLAEQNKLKRRRRRKKWYEYAVRLVLKLLADQRQCKIIADSSIYIYVKCSPGLILIKLILNKTNQTPKTINTVSLLLLIQIYFIFPF